MEAEKLHSLIQKQRDFYGTGKTRDVSFRKQQLQKLKRMIKDNGEAIKLALNQDLNKSSFEAYATEIGIVCEEINFLLKNLNKYTRPRRVKTALSQLPGKSVIYKEPYGVTLVMSPWNYPVQLTLSPLAGLIACGNCGIVKPSAYSSATSSLLHKLISQTFPEEYIAVVTGGREANEALLKEKFDYIFFTGSVEVGKTVMRAASNFLTPVTLELGGKSPCIVEESADIDKAAKRIVWGKFLNAGQTCVAPDYVLADRKIEQKLLLAIEKYIERFYGKRPVENDAYPKIVNEKHFERLSALVKDTNIFCGGGSCVEKLKIEPTVLTGVDFESPVMREEIFGPLLPIMVFDSLNEVVSNLQGMPRPLALYVFSSNKTAINKIIHSLNFGGGCVNDTVLHLATAYMPFGGSGASGMGSYHGAASFDTFSRKKSILVKSAGGFDIPFRFPPYSEQSEKMLEKLIK